MAGAVCAVGRRGSCSWRSTARTGGASGCPDPFRAVAVFGATHANRGDGALRSGLGLCAGAADCAGRVWDGGRSVRVVAGRLLGMATSQFLAGPIWVYKNRNAGPPGKTPRCICCFPGNRAGTFVPLKYGVTIALCDRHSDPVWMRSQSGRVCLSIVGTTFSSLGC